MQYFLRLTAITLFFSMVTGCKESAKESSSSQGPKDPACRSLTQQQCSSSSDCTQSGTECIASSSFCSKFSAKAQCDQMNSCNWDTMTSECKAPTPANQNSTGGNTNQTTDCGNISEAVECSTNYSCQWDASNTKCITKPNTDSTTIQTCQQLFDQTTCAARYGCQWNGITCIDSTTTVNCSQYYSQAQCVSPQCTWSGTQCLTAGTNNNGSLNGANCVGKEIIACLLAKECAFLPFGPCRAK